MENLERELRALKRRLAQLERGSFAILPVDGSRKVDVLAVVKASYRRRISALSQRLAQAS
jgi:hypothetical protein